MLLNIICGILGFLTTILLWFYITAARANNWCYKELRKKGYDDSEAKEIRAEINRDYGLFVTHTGGGGTQLRGYMDMVINNY